MLQFPPEVLRIAHIIRSHDGIAMLVGGSVRDMLLNIAPKDFDLEIFGIEPERLEAIILSLNPSSLDTVGRSFGILKVHFGDVEFDISIPRQDSKMGEGHRGFEIHGDPYMSPKEAARRRDFTINSLAIDPLSSEIFDFFGGREDLDNGILRMTNEAHFADDPLRVLRLMQFAARFEFEVDNATFRVSRTVVSGVEFAALPASRIGEEWRKLFLKAHTPSRGLSLGLELGVIHVLHSQLADLVGVPQDPQWHPEGDVWTHTLMALDAASEIVRREGITGDNALVIILGALCHDFGKPQTTEVVNGRIHAYGHHKAGIAPTEEFCARLGLGKGLTRRVSRLVADHMFLATNESESITDAAIRRLARRLEPVTIRELTLVMESDICGRACHAPPARVFAARELTRRADELEVHEGKPAPLLMGRHLINELGWEPSPMFGRVLNAVYEAQLAGEITTFEQALATAKSKAHTA